MSKRKYTDKQKADVIALLTLGEKSSKIGKKTGVNASTVRYMKANLKKIQEKDGSLGYHFEKRKRFVNKGWKGIELAIEKIIKGLKAIEPRTLKDVRDIAVILGILKDKVDKASPPLQLEAGAQRPLIDLSEKSTADLEMIIARVTLKDKTMPPQLEEGEVIEGESREVT